MIAHQGDSLVVAAFEDSSCKNEVLIVEIAIDEQEGFDGKCADSSKMILDKSKCADTGAGTSTHTAGVAAALVAGVTAVSASLFSY